MSSKSFYGVSGLKIIFSEFELVPLNLDDCQIAYFPYILNCKICKFPMKYLGLSLH